jgi:hypothetical protein
MSRILHNGQEDPHGPVFLHASSNTLQKSVVKVVLRLLWLQQQPAGVVEAATSISIVSATGSRTGNRQLYARYGIGL